MKPYTFIHLFFLFIGVSVFSQTSISLEEKRSMNEKMEFGSFIGWQLNSLNFLTQQDIKIDGQVFIKQIGNQNNINSVTSSANSDLKLFQYGNGNYISFIIDAEKLEGMILQEGDRNNAFDFTIDPTQDISANLLQQGNNLHFERYGANSIGNNLKFEMTGENKTVIVRNFK